MKIRVYDLVLGEGRGEEGRGGERRGGEGRGGKGRGGRGGGEGEGRGEEGRGGEEGREGERRGTGGEGRVHTLCLLPLWLSSTPYTLHHFQLQPRFHPVWYSNTT